MSIFNQVSKIAYPSLNQMKDALDEHEIFAYPRSDEYIVAVPVSQEREEWIKLTNEWRDLSQKQRCEILALKAKVKRLEASLQRIADLDSWTNTDARNGLAAEADYFHLAQKIARTAITPITSVDRSKL